MRFVFWFAFFIVAVGLTLHLELEVPWIGPWLGSLPGDLIIKKGGIVFYVPLTTSFLLTAILSFIYWLLFKPSN